MSNNIIFEFSMPDSEIEIVDSFRHYNNAPSPELSQIMKLRDLTFELPIAFPFGFEKFVENYNCELVVLTSQHCRPSEVSLKGMNGNILSSSSQMNATLIHSKPSSNHDIEMSGYKSPLNEDNSLFNMVVKDKPTEQSSIRTDLFSGIRLANNEYIFWHRLNLDNMNINHTKINITIPNPTHEQYALNIDYHNVDMGLTLALAMKDDKGSSTYIPLSYHFIDNKNNGEISYYTTVSNYIHKKANPIAYGTKSLKPTQYNKFPQFNDIASTGTINDYGERFDFIKLLPFNHEALVNSSIKNPLLSLEGKIYYSFKPGTSSKPMIINLVPPAYAKNEGALKKMTLASEEFLNEETDGEGIAMYTLGTSSEDTHMHMFKTYKGLMQNGVINNHERYSVSRHQGHQSSTLKILNSHKTKEAAYQSLIWKLKMEGINAKEVETAMSEHGYKVLYNHKKKTYDVIEHERIHSLDARPEFASDMKNFLPESGHEFFKVGNTFYLRFTSDKPVSINEIINRAKDFMQPWQKKFWVQSEALYLWQKTAGIYSEKHKNFGQFTYKAYDGRSEKLEKARCLKLYNVEHLKAVYLNAHDGKEHFQFTPTQTYLNGKKEAFLSPLPFDNKFKYSKGATGFSLVTIGQKHSHSINY